MTDAAGDGRAHRSGAAVPVYVVNDGWPVSAAPAPSYDAAAVTLFAAMSTQPDSTRKAAINTLITSLKTDDIWPELQEFWVFAAHAEQAALLGWKRYRDCVAVNAPTFAQDRGFTGNGTTSYLNTQFVPSTDGVQYTLNDASLGVYSRTDSNIDTAVDIGSRAEDGSETARISVRAFNQQITRTNQGQSSQLSISVANSQGLAVGRRTASNAQQSFRNGVSIGSNTTASTILPPRAFFVGAVNDNGTAAAFSTRQYAAAFVGAAMTEQQQADFYTHLQTYLTTLGAAV